MWNGTQRDAVVAMRAVQDRVTVVIASTIIGRIESFRAVCSQKRQRRPMTGRLSIFSESGARRSKNTEALLTL
jgi:hypothetical protein